MKPEAKSDVKYVHVAQLIEDRIHGGEYADAPLPAERELALETGVSRVTIRRVLQELEAKGVLRRLPNRRLVVDPSLPREEASDPIAVLAPTMISGVVSAEQLQWFQAINLAAEARGRRVHLNYYLHWQDRVVTQVLRDHDQVFLIPSAEPMNSTIEGLLRGKPGVVSLSVDLTGLGIPSILSYRPEDVRILFDHLHTLGHGQVHCVNVQGRDSVIDERIGHWRAWREERGLGGELLEVDWEPGEDVFAVAMAGVAALLGGRRNRGQAFFCTTLPAAIGAVHSLHRQGLRFGADAAVCTVDGEGFAEYMLPGITCLRRPEARGHLASAIDWMSDQPKLWRGPRLAVPAASTLIVGGSTGG